LFASYREKVGVEDVAAGSGADNNETTTSGSVVDVAIVWIKSEKNNKGSKEEMVVFRGKPSEQRKVC